ncbi:hypothetical protein [Luteolibacter soli]|uniref:Uncharacterized protein n=1 Tax=Luteolibacter soli TaxID=3135280 RepID=A0ABU9AWD6_9BACT
MNHNHSPRGRRFVAWSIAGCLALVAAGSTYAIVTSNDSRPIAVKVGDLSNRVVRAASKLGMGISSLAREQRPAEGKAFSAGTEAPASSTGLPAGVVATGKSGTAATTRLAQLPEGMVREGVPTTLVGKGAEELDRISTSALITASKPEGTGK